MVLIGTSIDKEGLEKHLQACLVSDEEYQAGPKVWLTHLDPIHPWEFVEQEEETASVNESMIF